MHDLLIRALSRLGISAGAGKGGVFRGGGKKIGGSAFCYRKEKVLHHGTLLLDADLGRLKSSLSPPRLMISTHAVASLPTAVMNLRSRYPEVNPQRILTALETEAEDLFGAMRGLPASCLPDSVVCRERDQLASFEWMWGQTPRFQTRLNLPGSGSLDLTVYKGRVTEVHLNGEVVRMPDPVPFGLGHFGELDGMFHLAPGEISAALQREGWDLATDPVHPPDKPAGV
jgi:lipoate-protein ligase A